MESGYNNDLLMKSSINKHLNSNDLIIYIDFISFSKREHFWQFSVFLSAVVIFNLFNTVCIVGKEKASRKVRIDVNGIHKNHWTMQ